jgi:hypothetical protein
LFLPRKGAWVLTEFRIQPTEELVTRLEEAKLDVATGFGRRLHVRLTAADLDRNRDVLADLIRVAADAPPPPQD